MLKKISGASANALLSAFIGLLVGIILSYFPGYSLDTWYTLSTSTGIGILIGTTSRFSACLAYEYGLKHPLWSYVLTFFITLLGCLIVSLPLFNWSRLMPCILIAEPLSLFAAYLNQRYTSSLNDSLKRKQAQLQKEHNNK